MVVLILENVPTRLRGELSRWMIEPRAGVFVGSVSGMVRDKLWEEAKKGLVEGEGGATLVYNSNTEQGFAIRTFGKTRREVVEFEGLMLVSVPEAHRSAGAGEAGDAPKTADAGGAVERGRREAEEAG